MNKRKLRTGEAVCVVILIFFMLLVSLQDKVSDEPVEKVREAVEAVCDLEGLESRDGLYLKKNFSFDFNSFKGFCCYSSDAVMDVRELIIINVGDKSASDAVVKEIKKYVTEKENLFDGYAPEQSDLISSHVLLDKKGYVLFYVGEERAKVTSAFSKSL